MLPAGSNAKAHRFVVIELVGLVRVQSHCAEQALTLQVTQEVQQGGVVAGLPGQHQIAPCAIKLRLNKASG